MKSSPDSQVRASFPTFSTSCTCRSMFAVASFSPTMAPALASRATVSGRRSPDVREGTLYATMGKRVASWMAR